MGNAAVAHLVHPWRDEVVVSELRAAVLASFMRGERVTTDTIVRATGRSRSEVNRHLNELRDDGWLTWEDGTRGAMRPTFECAWPAYMLT